MYDACEPRNIPKDATMVAGYIYGNCAWPASVWASWAHVTCVRIATVAFLDDGQVLDVESGDASPTLAPGWCVRARARGQDPTVYCNESTWPTVRAAFAAQHVAEPHWWIAHYGVAPVIPAGAIALQYRNSVAPGFDVSVVADYWPGVDPAPKPITQGERETMYLFIVPMPVGVWCLYFGHYFHITEPASETAFAAVAVHAPQPITAAQHAVLLATYPNNATVAGGGPIASGGAL
jgi:hypothetical protein